MCASPFLCGNYAPVGDERIVHDLPISGRLPAGLRGTLFRNGANPRFPPAQPYHWFTGDGMVHAVTLGDGRAGYRNRWICTPRFLAEAAAGRALFSGFGQPATEAARGIDTGVANTHVLSHAGRLLALEEAHLPTRLDPGDLSTLGAENFGGAVSGRFTAHPKHDPRSGQLVFFGYSTAGPFSPGMRWGIIDADGTVSRQESFEAPYCSMVHDFAVTASHVVFPVLPLTGDLGRARSGGPAFAWEPERGGFLGVMRRDRGAADLSWIACESRFAFHVMNAFDDEAGSIVIDLVEYDAPPLFPRADGGPADAGDARLCRWRVDPAARTVRRELLDALPGEFPRIDERHAGLPYRYGMRICRIDEAGTEAIVRHDLRGGGRSLFTLPPGERASEAVFVAEAEGSAEGEGWLLTLVWRPEHDDSVLLVLDARALGQGPVASVAMPRRVPFGFHGSWVPEATPAQAGAGRR